MKFRCSVLKCPSLKDRSPKESCIPASEEISFHSLPNDEPRRSKWLHFVNFANGGEKELKVVRVCSLHFRRSDYARDPYVSSLLGHAAARRRLIHTAVPSVVPPGQPEYSGPDESHPATSFGVPSEDLQEQPDCQGRLCVGTQTAHDVGNNKSVQVLIRGRNKSVQTNITVACDKAVRVVRRDVRPAKPTSVKRRRPEAHLPSPGVQTDITVKEACDKTVRVESREIRPATKSTSVQCQFPEAHLPSPDVSPARRKDNASGTVYKQSLFYGFVEGVQVSIMVKETCYKAVQAGSRPTKSTPIKRRHPEAHLPSLNVLPPRGTDNASDTVYEQGNATLASESTLGKQ